MFINSESCYSGQLNIVTSWGDNFLLLRLGHFFITELHRFPFYLSGWSGCHLHRETCQIPEYADFQNLHRFE